MNKAILLIPILAGAVVTAYALSASLEDSKSTTVVTVPPRPVEVASRPPPPPPLPKTASVPGDTASLARELQRELKRVGCYDGDINGAWTTSTRAAMKTFTERVNASLPIEKPDYILLSLVQGHQGQACGSTCPAGQTADGGRCVPNAVMAARDNKAAATPGAPAPAPEAPAAALAPLSSTVAAARALPQAPPAPRSEITPPVPREASRATPAPAAITRIEPEPPAPREPSRLAATSALRDPPGPPPAVREEPLPRRQAMAPDGPVPPVGIYERRKRRHHAYRASSRPPKFVRSLIRSVQRSLAPFGFR